MSAANGLVLDVFVTVVALGSTTVNITLVTSIDVIALKLYGPLLVELTQCE